MNQVSHWPGLTDVSMGIMHHKLALHASLCVCQICCKMLHHACYMHTCFAKAWHLLVWHTSLVLQVLVLDLDGTLIHTAAGDERESFQNCQHAVELYVQDQDQSFFCIPRARLLEFSLEVLGKYYIMFCTAGSPQYAEVVTTVLRETLLSTGGLTLQQKDSITRSVKFR